MKILLIDNYDSFTQNIAHLAKSVLRNMGLRYFFTIAFNDSISISQIKQINPDFIIISPGPCSPNESGICPDVVLNFYKQIPILGICLGHQVICQVFGGRIIKTAPFHGRLSTVVQTNFENSRILKNIPRSFNAVRYHSLVMDGSTNPQDLIITGVAKEDGAVMVVEHTLHPCFGVQFHPESFLSECGDKIFENFFSIKP